MTERRFVLMPFSLLSPELIHPQSKQTIAQLLAACADNNLVQVLKP
jgi:7,8-dihydro-6-hydroxymethylpterin-pyrophosphokinase